MTCREEIQDLLSSGTLGFPLGIERPLQSHDPIVAECSSSVQVDVLQPQQTSDHRIATIIPRQQKNGETSAGIEIYVVRCRTTRRPIIWAMTCNLQVIHPFWSQKSQSTHSKIALALKLGINTFKKIMLNIEYKYLLIQKDYAKYRIQISTDPFEFQKKS